MRSAERSDFLATPLATSRAPPPEDAAGSGSESSAATQAQRARQPGIKWALPTAAQAQGVFVPNSEHDTRPLSLSGAQGKHMLVCFF